MSIAAVPLPHVARGQKVPRRYACPVWFPIVK